MNKITLKLTFINTGDRAIWDHSICSFYRFGRRLGDDLSGGILYGFTLQSRPFQCCPLYLPRGSL